ncbi:MAG: hypothetical protein ACLTDR_15165 [Adlercreutzia equolifaciens]
MFSTRPRALVGALVLQGANEAGLVDDHLHDLAQIAPVGGAVLDDLDELPHGIAGGRGCPDRPTASSSRREKRRIHLAAVLVGALDGGLADASGVAR